MNDKYLTVTALTRYLKYKFDEDENLRNVFLKGEISNFKKHTSGHFYFSIKDEHSKINAIMFNKQASKLSFVPTEGMKVMISGNISVYEATGNYQVYVNELIEDGIGNLYVAFEKLKEKLTKEGLFDSKYKKEIPKIPSKIGIITASTGAAIRDIISTIKRRYPACQAYLFPCLVQGENAAPDIRKKIIQANNYDLDILIVGRGGGSFEDLNDEGVARALFDSHIPVISAVGHEVDFTIADFVADLRAPTPTGAAEMAVPNVVELIKQLDQFKIRLSESIYKTVNYQKLYLDSLKNSFVIKNPMMMYDSKKQKLDGSLEKIVNLIHSKIDNYQIKLNHIKDSYVINNPEYIYKEKKQKLKTILEKLELVSPIQVLKRGYSVTYQDNKIVRSIQDVKVNDNITLKLADGTVEAKIEQIREENHEKR